MWLKLCLLLIYITILFILARILEAISWYETGALSKRLLDPMTLSVLKLKALLEQRGVSFEGVVLEKSDLTELVEGSGPVTDDEVDCATKEEEASAVTNFTSGMHFFEMVEDAKDSVWLIQVYTHQGTVALLGDSRWKAIRKKVSRFGVRAGILDCSHDVRYCESRGWMTPRLLLALPGEFAAKSSVHIHTYTGPGKINLMYNWIRENLDGKVEKITDEEKFSKDWFQFSDPFLNPEIRTVLFTDQKIIPMFYTALSVKFPGRVKFGVVDTSSSSGKEIMKFMVMRNRTKVPQPSYMIITAEQTLIYGQKDGEHLSFPAMETYFKTLYPCLNDIFIITIMITNVLSVFELCLVQGTLFKRMKKFLWYFVKCNVILIMLWLPIVGLFQLPYLDKVPLWLLKGLRMFATTNMAAHLRKDLSFYMLHSTVLASVFIAYTLFVGFVEYKRKGGEVEEEQDDENYWNFTEMRTLEHLIRPVGQMRASIIIGDRRLYELVETAAPSSEYICQLPTWNCALRKDDSCTCCKMDAAKVETIPNVESGCGSKLKERQHFEVQELYDGTTSSFSPNQCQCSCHVTLKPTWDAPLVDSNLPEGFLPATQCVICLDDFRFGVLLCGLPCSHTFHKACVVNWLKTGSHICPVCRWPANRPKPCDMQLLSE